MKIAYVDLMAGASGDMILGALIDAGVSAERLREGLAGLDIGSWDLDARRVLRGAIAATQVTVRAGAQVREHVHHHDRRAHPDDGHTHHGRSPGELLDILDRSNLPRTVIERSKSTIRRIAEAEAAIHAQPVETVHLHEIGAVDTLVDVAGAFLGFELLGLTRVHVSRFPLAHGIIASQHGPLPLPAPATLALLEGAPVRVVSGVEAELVTPTGAAILTTLADGYEDCPPMTLRTVGLGAGSRELPIPNVLRLWIGDGDPVGGGGLITESLVALECNVDDMSGERFGFAMERLFAEGALDVTLSPVQMKKNRPATRLWVLARPADAARLTSVVLAETTTLGVRRTALERVSLPREVLTVKTPYGDVRVKVAGVGTHRKYDPEYEDLRALALSNGISIADVEGAAIEAARRDSFHPDARSGILPDS